MKNIQLSQNKLAIVDDEDYDYLNQFTWYAVKYKYTYYSVKCNYKYKKNDYMHRIIMNCPDGKFIDHINHNGIDNRKENLRICTEKENQGNRKLNKNNTSGFRGVFKDKCSNKWRARIRLGKNIRKHLGYFTNINDAKKAYDKAAKKHFGKFYSDNIKQQLEVTT